MKHMRGRRLRRARLNTKSSSSVLAGSIENPPPPRATPCLAADCLRFRKFFPAVFLSKSARPGTRTPDNVKGPARIFGVLDKRVKLYKLDESDEFINNMVEVCHEHSEGQIEPGSGVAQEYRCLRHIPDFSRGRVSP